METGVAHPAAVVTDLTCPPDIHLQSTVSSALHCLLPCFPSPSHAPIPFSLCLPTFIPSFFFPNTCSVPFSVFLLYAFSFTSFSLCDSWALTAFYFSFFFFSATVRERPGIGGLVKTNRRPCGSPRVATRHNKPPAPCRRGQMVHRGQATAASEGPNRTCRIGFHDNQTATLAVVRCRVTVDTLKYWRIEPPGLMCTRWNINSKSMRGKLYFGWMANIDININKISKNVTVDEKIEYYASVQGELFASHTDLYKSIKQV